MTQGRKIQPVWSALRSVGLIVAIVLVGFPAGAAPTFSDVIAAVQPMIVKVYGAGGLQGLESYQSGFLISADGYILTALTTALDTDELDVTLDDGRKFTAQLVGADPRIEIAVLKIDAAELPYFPLAESPPADAGTRVLAFSNLFRVAQGNEPASVQHGHVAAVAPLTGRRGTYETPYRGKVYVLDAITNNPGAAGGALTDHRGRLIGMLGKELRNSLNNIWLNYALPISELTVAVEDIQAGKVRRPDGPADRRPADSLSLERLGIVLIPNVVARTPAYIDAVRAGSPAAKADLRPDDLIILVNDRLTQTCAGLEEALGFTPGDAKVKLTVLRDQQLLDVLLQANDR